MSELVNALIVADAGPASAALVAALERDVDICVVAEANSPIAALRTVARYRPDIVVLDLGVDHDSGHRIVADIMNRAPTPMLVLSATIADRSSPSAVDALGAGALDVLPLPPEWTPPLGAALRDAVRRLSRAWVIRHLRGATVDEPHWVPAGPPVVAMAASTGGPRAFASVLAEFAGLPAAVLLVQHLHPEFAGSLLDWMQRVSALPVEFGSSGARIRPGRAYLAPPGVHMRLSKHGLLELDDRAGNRAPPVGRRAVHLGGRAGRTVRHRCRAHRYGRRRSARAAGHAPPREPDDRPGRADVRGVRHATSRRARRRGQ